MTPDGLGFHTDANVMKWSARPGDKEFVMLFAKALMFFSTAFGGLEGPPVIRLRLGQTPGTSKKHQLDAQGSDQRLHKYVCYELKNKKWARKTIDVGRDNVSWATAHWQRFCCTFYVDGRGVAALRSQVSHLVLQIACFSDR